MLCNETKDELTLTARITRINKTVDIFALDQFLQNFEARLCLNDGA